MNLFSLYCFWLIVLVGSSLSSALWAQPPAVDVYRITVVLKSGDRLRGILSDVTGSYLVVGANKRSRERTVPLENVRKVVIRRNSRKSALISGAIVGALAVGYLSNQSLQKNLPRSPIAYGLTLTFAAAGGAAGGLLLGSVLGNVTSRIVRPLNRADPENSLSRQLEPFSVRYQQDLINRLPKNPQ